MPKTSLLDRLAAAGACIAAVALTFSFIALLASHGLPADSQPLMALADPAVTRSPAQPGPQPASQVAAAAAGHDVAVVR